MSGFVACASTSDIWVSWPGRTRCTTVLTAVAVLASYQTGGNLRSGSDCLLGSCGEIKGAAMPAKRTNARRSTGITGQRRSTRKIPVSRTPRPGPLGVRISVVVLTAMMPSSLPMRT